MSLAVAFLIVIISGEYSLIKSKIEILYTNFHKDDKKIASLF